jgi:hypothetical protein
MEPPVRPAPPAEPVEDESLPANAPVVSMTATAYYEAVKKDPKGTHAKLKGSIVELTGTIDNINLHPFKKGWGQIILKVDGGLKYVDCYPVESEPWKKVSVNQMVKIRGVRPDDEAFASDVTLRKCVFVDLRPDPTPSLTSEQLATEYAADRKATIAKYHKRGKIIVTGEIVAKEKNEAGAAGIYLKGQGKIRVEAGFTGGDQATTDAFKVGQKITVYGTVLDFEHKDDTFALRFCDLLKQP